jgi:hypothetical protein
VKPPAVCEFCVTGLTPLRQKVEFRSIIGIEMLSIFRELRRQWFLFLCLVPAPAFFEETLA